MARKTPPAPADDSYVERIVDIDVEEEMQGAFLEYAYSVIYSRALPDARDGLKPVQRRILYSMSEMGLRPDRGHVKSSRVVGDVMGKYHPHGDTAIYDALVRMAQPFTMRLPLVDGHGNFGSLDDGPAASRYTEARLAPAAMLMVTGLDEETVDFIPNYDDQLLQPAVLPAAFPNLLVNGASGIAVGMATNMAPHNLVEVIGAARHLIANPTCSLDDLMRFVPGPDLPQGGRIIGLDGIRDAYLNGRGSFRTRATTRIEKTSPRRMGIVVTELPYLVGPEKVIEKIKDAVQSKKLQGISDVKDLTDRKHGLRLVIEVKNGFNPDAVLEQLYKLTPMEDSFSINNVALVDGQPKTLGLKDLLRVYVDFRTDVVRRRTEYRLTKYKDRLHLVEGLLIAILDIDEVIQVIRTSDDAAAARARLIDVFDLSEAQANYILELQLRRLTRFSRLELDKEKTELERLIEELEAILGDEKLLMKTVSTELADVAKAHGTPRRTVLLESAGVPATTTTPLEVADDPCWVLLSSTGLMARTGTADPLPAGRGPQQARRPRRRGPHDRPRRGRAGHLARPAGPALRARAAHPAADQRVAQPVRRRAARGLRRPARRRGAADPRVGLPRVGRHRARHRAGRRQARHDGLPRPPRLRGRLAQGRRRGRRRRRAGVRARRTWSSSPPTPSCCVSAPRPCDPRAGPPAGWPASSSAPGQRVTFFGAVPQGADARGGHLLRLLRRAPRHRARLAQGHPLLRVPAPRAAPPAGCAATASSRARTPWSWPGPARCRPGPRPPTAWRSSSPRPPAAATAPGVPAATAIARIAGPPLS